MHLFLGLPLALCALSLVSPAPIQEPWKDMQDTEFQEAVESGHSLTRKILDDINKLHKSWVHTSFSLDEKVSSKLEYLKKILDLPAAPAIKPLSDSFTLSACLSQIAKGLKLHQTLLTVVSKLSHTKSEMVDGLLCDIRDLLLQVRKMQDLKNLPSDQETQAVSESQLQETLAPKISDEHISHVAAHLTLHQLREFGKDVRRTFRSMTVPSDLDN
ncbi:colony stimulating factor 3 (granulocyte) a [Colossoma macropomum]|uniref:colony stimulating factor 3 (granulocyte) a n=1 Tax=Colossoma macropomum TaxID=42526 RepID=UPI00186518BE|nr:colony stimulating factor 3 (granulocyte) a [Colossoma macropomum]